MGRSYPHRTPARLLPSRPFAAAVFMLAFTALLYVLEFVDLTGGQSLSKSECIVPRQPDRLADVLIAPLLHAGWWHVNSNALGFLLFGFLAMAAGIGRFIAVTVIVWLVSGLGVWLIAPSNSCTVGASGVIFGWLMYLLFRGFFNRSARQILLAVVLLVLWGGVLWGLLPGQPGVSWQAHLFGAIGGILAARMMAKLDRRRPEEPVMPR
ncbi:MAG TPA: rhomboid family intramembrane serine protease [Pseudonocardia sp.]|jgi:membrane associated rhomboid family serine protease